jgi:hypothetical protein
MKPFRLLVHNQQAFDNRLTVWLLMRDVIGGGSWESVAYLLGADKYVHGPKRIKKKRLRRYMHQMIVQDLYQEGQCEHAEV